MQKISEKKNGNDGDWQDGHGPNGGALPRTESDVEVTLRV